MIELAKAYPQLARNCLRQRALLSFAIQGKVKELGRQLYKEELLEREKDVEYWAPLKRELETLRHQQLK